MANRKRATQSNLAALLAEFPDAASLGEALRYATLDGPRGALPVLRELSAHPGLVHTSVALLQAFIDYLNGRLPRVDPARWPPRACDEPVGHFLVRAGRYSAFEALAPRLLQALLLKYHQRATARAQLPRPIDIPDPYIWSRACRLLVEGASQLDPIRWPKAADDLAAAAFAALKAEDIGAQPDYLYDLARRALLLDVPTTIKTRGVVHMEELIIAPRLHPATTGLLPMHDLVGAVSDGRTPGVEGLGTNDILGISGRVTMTDRVA
ncbi:MAG: hypothetical protein ACRDHX_03575, partial [Chloroflexota bacterium]